MIDTNEFQGAIVLFNDASQLIKGESRDIIAEQDVVKCALEINEWLNSGGINARLAAITDEPETVLKNYDPRDWLIFNLAEGYGGKFYEEARIAWLLETKGYFFTGSGGRSIALTTNKALTKCLLTRIGLRTPDWWLFHSPDQIEADMSFPFPLFVKPVAEDASLGIENQSVVHDLRSLRDRVSYVVDSYQQSALVEEFIPGREINAAAWGDPLQLLPLAEIDFQRIDDPAARIVNYGAKWLENSYEFQHTPAICPADIKTGLHKRISRAVLSALKCAGVKSYARVDMRISDDGIPYILEINCNPDISSGAGFYHTVNKTGLTYQEMALRILHLARRHSDDYCPARNRC